MLICKNSQSFYEMNSRFQLQFYYITLIVLWKGHENTIVDCGGKHRDALLHFITWQSILKLEQIMFENLHLSLTQHNP
jgi:hypothetical protein